MSDQGELQLWPRDHDLPPRWDGLPVEWADWKAQPQTFICPPPRRPTRCEQCGSEAQPLMTHGRVWTNPADAPPAIRSARLRRGRHLVGIITAFRCRGCGQDTVLDIVGKMWVLDPTDYSGDDGSWDNCDTGRS